MVDNGCIIAAGRVRHTHRLTSIEETGDKGIDSILLASNHSSLPTSHLEALKAYSRLVLCTFHIYLTTPNSSHTPSLNPTFCHALSLRPSSRPFTSWATRKIELKKRSCFCDRMSHPTNALR